MTTTAPSSQSKGKNTTLPFSSTAVTTTTTTTTINHGGKKSPLVRSGNASVLVETDANSNDIATNNKKQSAITKKTNNNVNPPFSATTDTINEQTSTSKKGTSTKTTTTMHKKQPPTSTSMSSSTKKRTIPVPWRAAEDKKVRDLVAIHGDRNWTKIAKALPGRTGKQCRERWYQHLDPKIKKSRSWTRDEDRIILKSHLARGNQWASLARKEELCGRSDNALKNHWNSSMKCRIEHYLLEALHLNDDALLDENGRYAVPQNKVEECLDFISNITNSEMKKMKKLRKSKKTSRSTGGQTNPNTTQRATAVDQTQLGFHALRIPQDANPRSVPLVPGAMPMISMAKNPMPTKVNVIQTTSSSMEVDSSLLAATKNNDLSKAVHGPSAIAERGFGVPNPALINASARPLAPLLRINPSLRAHAVFQGSSSSPLRSHQHCPPFFSAIKPTKAKRDANPNDCPLPAAKKNKANIQSQLAATTVASANSASAQQLPHPGYLGTLSMVSQAPSYLAFANVSGFGSSLGPCDKREPSPLAAAISSLPPLFADSDSDKSPMPVGQTKQLDSNLVSPKPHFANWDSSSSPSPSSPSRESQAS